MASAEASTSAQAASPMPTPDAKGISKIPLVRNLVSRLVDKATLKLTSIETDTPKSGRGLEAKILIKVADLGLGPLPVKAKVRFDGPVQLSYIDSHTESATADGLSGANPKADATIPGTKRASRAGRLITSATIQPVKLRPNSPRSSVGETSLTLDGSNEAAERTGSLVRELLKTDTGKSVTILVNAQNVTVKAYGLTFKSLCIEKEVRLGGLGGLEGTLRFPDEGEVEKGVETTSTPGKRRASNPPTRESPHVVVENLQITGGNESDGILISANIELKLAQPGQGFPKMRIAAGNLGLDVCVPLSPSGEAKEPTVLQPIGSLTLADCIITHGSNRLQARGSIRLPNDLPLDSDEFKAAQGVLTKLLQNQQVSLIAAARLPTLEQLGVSEAAWLSYGFAGAQIKATLPPLGDAARLLDGAQLRADEGFLQGSQSSVSDRASRSRTSRSDSMSSIGAVPYSDQAIVRATVRNSFGTELCIKQLRVKAFGDDPNSSEGFELGVVDTPKDWPGIELPAGQIKHVNLPFDLNQDSAVLIRLMRSSAAREGVDLGEAFEEVLSLVDEKSSNGVQQGSVAEKLNSSTKADGPEDFSQLLTRALANLKVDAYIDIGDLSIGTYDVPGGITFVQRALDISIPTMTAAWILPRVGVPLITKLVENGRIELASINVQNLDESGITAAAEIALSGFGPLGAEVAFERPLSVLRGRGDKAGELVAELIINEPLRIDPSRGTVLKRIIRLNPVSTSAAGTFAAFIGSLLKDSVSDWRLETPAAVVTAGGTQFQPPFSKIITLKGFGGFPNLTLNSFDVTGEAIMSSHLAAEHGRRRSVGQRADAITFQASVTLTNPGSVSLLLSRLELDLLLEEDVLGQLSATDVHLKSGEELQLKCTGLVHEIMDKKRLGGLASDLLASREIELIARGRTATAAHADLVDPKKQRRMSVRSDGSMPGRPAVRVAWLDEALRQLRVPIKIQHHLHDVVRRIEMESLNATFPHEKDPAFSIGALIVKYEVPFPIDVAIEAVSADVEILLDDVVVGTGSAPHAQVLAAQEQAGSRRRRNSSESSQVEYASGTLKLALAQFSIQTTGPAFPKMIKHIFDCEETSRISVRGRASVTARTALGKLPVTVDLGEDNKVTIRGMRSLSTSPTDYTGLQVVAGTAEHLKVTFDLFLNNPSENVTFTLPDTGLSFAAFYRGAYVGRAHVGGKNGPFDLNSGPSAFRNVEFYYSPSPNEEKAVRQLPVNFLSGETTRLEIRGDDQSTDIESLRPALSSLRLAFDLKPIVDRTLIASIEIALGTKVLTSNSVECTFVISNPLKVPIDLKSLSFVANYRGKPFGSCSLEWPEGESLRVEAGSVEKPGLQSQKCLVRLAQRLDQLVRAFLTERGQLFLQVDLSAGVEMGSFKIPVFEYTQSIPLHIKNLSTVSKLLWALPST